MSSWIPEVGEERWMVVQERFGDAVARASGEAPPWRSGGLFLRGALFLLALFFVSSFSGFAALLTGFNSSHLAAPLFLTSVVSFAGAELLIRRVRFFGFGAEEALWLSGGAALAAAVLATVEPKLNDFPRWIAVAALLVCGAAAARLVHPLFATLAAGAAVAWVGISAESATAAGWTAAVVGFLALALSTRMVERPRVDAMLDWLVVTMPLAAYPLIRDFAFEPRTPAMWTRADFIVLLYLATVIAVFGAVGIGARLHPPLVVAMTACGALAFELRAVTGLALEVRLMTWGVLLLALSVTVERLLKTARRGITSVPIGSEARERSARWLQAAGSAAAAQQTQERPAAPEPQMQGGGGTFGGAGASGDF